jgi:hypothetical protein
MRVEEYRRFLKGTHRVKILQPDEPAPPGLAQPPVADAGGVYDPGLSSSHLVRNPEGFD